MNRLINWKDGKVPEAPYYANVFSYLLGEDLSGYQEMDDLTLELVHDVDGFLGFESSKSDGRGLFISYWRDLDAIETWRKETTHIKAKMEGMKRWYKYYHTMIVKVESARYHAL